MRSNMILFVLVLKKRKFVTRMFDTHSRTRRRLRMRMRTTTKAVAAAPLLK